MAEAYKNVEEVVEKVHRASLARKVARLRPIGVFEADSPAPGKNCTVFRQRPALSIGFWKLSWFGNILALASLMGAVLISFFEWFGELGLFCRHLARAVFVPPYEGRELIRQLDAIGSKSLPLVALAGAATGLVLSLQTRDSLTRFGAKSMLPAVIVFSLIKETGPIITALVVSGRVGAGIGAELGSMKVTEQIDAMEVSAVNPYKFLAATRVIACVTMLPLLTLAANFCGVIMGWAATTMAQPVSLRYFIENGFKRVTFDDFLPPTLKTAVFGLIIGLVACFQGMRTKGGTEGVGRSATSAVVLCSLFVILADVLLVRLILVFFP